MRYSLLPVLLVLGCARPEPAAAQTALELAPFRSVALSDGGRVVIRHGAAQRVTLVEGEADVTVEGTRLRIGRCRSCPRRVHPRVEIVTPTLDSLSVDNGGAIVVENGFPSQPVLAAAVDNGGAIDARGLDAGQVAASIAQGGMIYVRPSRALQAAIRQGGAITYWGDPAVQSAVSHGGVVQRGRAQDESRPLADLAPSPPKRLPVPPVPERE